ncbi:hypothetical protein HMPREF1529_00632 [Microbacterium sp. oral taxon 186 str. F0373]|jgi:hypothetical protein|nr:hypothetical protein HMPREF1529_00632 [Microbacterium sp. oral taxon 186 str. F0373]
MNRKYSPEMRERALRMLAETRPFAAKGNPEGRALVALDSAGAGMYLPVAALFLIQVRGLSVADAGLALGIGAVVGLLFPALAGTLVDRAGPRGVIGTGQLHRAIAMLVYLLLPGWLGAIAGSAICAAGMQLHYGALLHRSTASVSSARPSASSTRRASKSRTHSTAYCSHDNAPPRKTARSSRFANPASCERFRRRVSTRVVAPLPERRPKNSLAVFRSRCARRRVVAQRFALRGSGETEALSLSVKPVERGTDAPVPLAGFRGRSTTPAGAGGAHAGVAERIHLLP